ncbi:uncharacterized protein LOC133196384 [Saccostrea echinata]|uniref:uncharacterized protein LOC133196384 n=1 Tax=Saccostrea echinata TaxID=191078 RepID=UPI002A7F597F|nr:uncharacterized protein LOC133196384 [Saccostrea echinata]
MDTFYTELLILMHCCLVQSDIAYKSLFYRMPKLRMAALPITTLNNVSVEACARSCVQESTFDCQSFDMDNKLQSCRLHNNTHESDDMSLIVSKNTDHYRTYFEGLFNRLPNHILTFDHKRQISEISVEQCARRCVLEATFRCLGFDYEVKLKNCWLTDILPPASRGLIPQVNTDYYERQSNGPLEYFINFGYGSLQQLEGEQIYHKTVMGVSLVACAHLCLAENSFKCTSFDYVFDDKSCYLSMYIAANVYGLVTSRSDDKNVVHYEFKDDYLRRFYPTPYSAILGHNEKTVSGITPSACARKCLEENIFICRSFDYQVQEGTCLLSTKTGSDVGGLISQGISQVHHFEMKPYLDCGGHLKTNSGYLASPNWPRNYEHNLNCSWTITVPKFKIIKISFTHLKLFKESLKSCTQNSDRLLIVDKQQVTCLENNVREFISQSNVIIISFITNDKGDAPGFRLQYKTDWACGGHFTDPYGEISSPGWPMGYLPSQNCTWEIEAPPSVRIYLSFVKVDLEEHIKRSCHSSYDVIEISEESVNSSTFLCGKYDHFTYNSTGNILYIQFISDSRVEKSGFHAFYTFVYNKLLSKSNSTPTEIYDYNFTYKLELLATDRPENGNYSSNEISEGSPGVHYIDFHLQPTAETPIGKSNFTLQTERLPEIFRIEKDLHLVIVILAIAFSLVLAVLLSVIYLTCRYFRRLHQKESQQKGPLYLFNDDDSSIYEKDNIMNGETEKGRERDSENQPSLADVSFINPTYDGSSRQLLLPSCTSIPSAVNS